VEKLARSTLALKHNEAQRSSLYHIDNNHLTSAKSPRAPARSGAQCTQYIFILQVKSDRQRKHLIQESAVAATLWLLQPKIGAEAKEVAAVADFCDQAKFGESKQKPNSVRAKFKCLVIHGVKNPSQDLQ